MPEDLRSSNTGGDPIRLPTLPHAHIRLTITLLILLAGSGLSLITPSVASADESITVKGRAVYEDADGNPQGIPNALLKVCELEFIPFCENHRTGPDGEFEVAFVDTLGASTIRVEVIADSAAVKAVPSGTILITYCFRKDRLHSSVEAGELDFGEIAPLHAEECNPLASGNTLHDPAENGAFYVFTQLQRAWDVMSAITLPVNGRLVPKVTVALTDNTDGVAFYNPLNQTIEVKPYVWDQSDDSAEHGYGTIFHEYGHHVLWSFAESPPPNYINGNCDDVSDFLIFEIPDPGHCLWLSEMGEIAWSEGFPDFLSAALDTEIYGHYRVARRGTRIGHGGVSYDALGYDFPPMEVVDTHDGVVWKLAGSKGYVDVHPDSDYEKVEGFTAAVLWDLYDSEDEEGLDFRLVVDDHDRDGGRDAVDLSLRDIWQVVTNYDPDFADDDHNHPTSIEEFHAGLIDELGLHPSEIASAFLENHISVPAADLLIDLSSVSGDWNPSTMYFRGDTIAVDMQVCNASSATTDLLLGAADFGIALHWTSTGERFHAFPPETITQTGGRLVVGTCTSPRTLEVEIPDNLRLLGPLGDQIFFSQFDVIACVDFSTLIGELNESNNCVTVQALRLQNQAPVIVTNAVDGVFEVDEGSSFSIDASVSFDPDPIPGVSRVVFSWTDSPQESLLRLGSTLSHSADFDPNNSPLLRDDGSAELRLTVRDVSRSAEADEQRWLAYAHRVFPVIVRNVSPSTFLTNVPVTGHYTIFEGSELVITGNFHDPGADSWEVDTFFFNVGDLATGTITTPPDEISHVGEYELRHVFDQDSTGYEKGLEDFLLCVRDDDGGTGCKEGTVAVLNVAPVVSLPASMSADEGTPLTVNGSFTDPGADTWTATVAVDGGTPAPFTVTGRSFAANLTLPQDGSYAVEICVDDGVAEGCKSTTVNVANVAPLFDLTAPVTLNEGAAYTVAGSFIDPGADTWTATVAFDGGSAQALTLSGKTFSVERSFPQDGSFSIEICVSDDDTTTCDTKSFTILNVAPQFDLTATVTLDEGAAYTVAGAFTDPGADTWTATVAFDGGSTQALTLAGKTFSVERNFPEDGSFSVEICVSDDDTQTCDTKSFTVLNVAPVITLVSVPDLLPILVGDSVHATFADPGVLDTHTATIDWGDGSTEAIGVQPHATATGALSATHAFGATGTFSVQLCVTDDDSGTGCASFDVAVVSVEEAVAAAIEDLATDAETDPAVADALKLLEGSTEPAGNGALDRLAAGDYVAALGMIAHAIEALEASATDYGDEQRLLALIAESVARDRLAVVEALGLSSRGGLRQLERIHGLIDDGRTLLEGSDYVAAVVAFQDAVQRAEDLISPPRTGGRR